MKTREEYNDYIRVWRKNNKDKVAANNKRYYERNKGYLNKSRTVPWYNDDIVKWIEKQDREHLAIMSRILRFNKDPLLGL